MVAFVCNNCKKPIDMSAEYCAHITVSLGKRGIESKGEYGNGYNADLCEDCYRAIGGYIDDYYFGGNKYLACVKSPIADEENAVRSIIESLRKEVGNGATMQWLTTTQFFEEHSELEGFYIGRLGKALSKLVRDGFIKSKMYCGCTRYELPTMKDVK